MHSLEGVFEDNEHPAAPIDCHDGAVTILIVFPSVDMIPDQTPATTPTGRPTLHRRSEQDRNRLYSQALGSTVLATVKETYATCPFLTEVKVMVVRRDTDASLRCHRSVPAGSLSGPTRSAPPQERHRMVRSSPAGPLCSVPLRPTMQPAGRQPIAAGFAASR
jgi:hypothetical protein